jgi:hypothetical protein
MLWREHYEPRVLTSVLVPKGLPKVVSEVTYVIVGGFGLAAISDQGVWWKLLKSSFKQDTCIYRIFISQAWTPKKERDANAMIPPSEKSSLILTEDYDQWCEIIQPDKPERGFAALVHQGKMQTLVIGPPTEEVWESFRDQYTALRT